MDFETLPPAPVPTANAARQTMWGRKFLVVNGTLIVPGVLPGSRGPLLYTPAECSREPHRWNGVPIVGPNHPRDPVTNQLVSARSPGVMSEYGIGWVFNTRFKNEKLGTQYWFDEELTKAHDRRHGTSVFADAEAGRPIETSTGLFSQDVPVGNQVCKRTGKPYTHEARDFRPDHVAVLPRSVGACSLADGCGVGVNEAAAGAGPPDANAGDKSVCKTCGRPIVYTGQWWSHKVEAGDNELRHPGVPVGNAAPDPTELKEVAGWLAKNGAMPGYGQVFVNGRDVWYVGGDGDSWAEENLPVAKFSAVPGVGKVTYEAEGFPPKDAGWVQVVPKRRPWVKRPPVGNSGRPADDCPGTERVPCGNCGGKGGKPGPCPGTGKGRAGTPKTSPALRDHNLNLARELLAAGDRPGVFHLAGLVGRLNTLTVPQLKGLRAEFVGSAAGRKAKADHVAAIESFLKAKPEAVRSMVAAEAARPAAKAGSGPGASAGKFWSRFGPAVKAFAAGAVAGVSRSLAANEVGAVTAADLRLALLNLAAAGDKTALAPFLAGRRGRPTANAAELPAWVRLAAPRPDCPGSDAAPCGNCGGKGGRPGPCPRSGTKSSPGRGKTNYAAQKARAEWATGEAKRGKDTRAAALQEVRAAVTAAKGGPRDRKQTVKHLDRAADNALRAARKMEARGDKAGAKNMRAAAYGFNLAAKHYGGGSYAKATTALKTAHGFLTGRQKLKSTLAANGRDVPVGNTGRRSLAALLRLVYPARPEPLPTDAAPAANARPQGGTGLTPQEAEAVPKPNPDDVAYLTTNCDCWKKDSRKAVLDGMDADTVADLRRAAEAAKPPAPTGNTSYGQQKHDGGADKPAAPQFTLDDVKKLMDDAFKANSSAVADQIKAATAETLAANEKRELVDRLVLANSRDDASAAAVRAVYEPMPVDSLRTLAANAPAAATYGFPPYLGVGGFGGPPVTANGAGGAEDVPDVFAADVDLYCNASDAARKLAAAG